MSNKVTRSSVLFKNIGKPIFLNFQTIEDEEWIRDRYPEGLMPEIKAQNVDAILEVFWRLIDNDGKRLIRDAKIVKWEGFVETPVDFSDHVAKLKAIVGGGKDEEMTTIIKALFETQQKSDTDPVATEKKSPQAAAR